MLIIIFSTKLLFSTRCNIVIKEICTVNYKKDIEFHSLLEVEEAFHSVLTYQCNCKETNLLY